VSKVYPGATPVVALHDVTLNVASGEFVALLGPSGCGKSTLLNMIAGFESTTSGELKVDGKTIEKPGPDRGVVFQEDALFPWLNVWDNVTFGPRTTACPKSEYEPIAREMLEITGLSAFTKHLPIQLSGGMRQRVGIARVLTLGSKVLLMDEPFGALDAQTRLTMQELLLSVWQKLHTTIVFVTHDIDEALLLADTVYVMSARPGTIATRLHVPLERPRTIEMTTSAVFNDMKREVLQQIRH
jgi:NitT/TauT family transport system ATP-binding protein